MGDRNAGDWRFSLALASLLTLLLCRALANVVLWRTGFTAISDDDFARVVIAQGFAQAPSWDPSGTSWLPLPFWLTGSTLWLFGTSLAVAKGCAFVSSLCSSALVFLAARWLGLALAPAFYGSLAATLLPHALWLGLATVPEGYTAALCVLALASLNCFTVFHRGLGAAALCAATLCRYESWPLAVAFAVCTALDVQRGRLGRAGWGIAAAALLGAAGWLLHGIAHHGNALFFLTRVAQYKQALGGAATGGLLHHPLLLLRAEPELMLAVLCGVVWVPQRSAVLARFRRPVGHALLVVIFLMVGDVLDGVATHHAERSLLVIWLLGTLLAADAWSSVLATAPRRHLTALGTFAAGALLITLLRDRLVPNESFVNRRAEVGIGLLAHRVVAKSPGVVAVHTLDYGHQAVIAALDLPGLAHTVTDHDPRLAEPVPDLESLATLGATWLIADKTGPLGQAPGTVYAENQRFVLLNLNER